MTTKITANAKQIEGFQLMLDDGEAHSYIADLASESSGTWLGASPLELCIMSHAGCYAIICIGAAKKMRLNLKGIKVHIEALKSEQTGTISEEAFEIQLQTDAPQDRIDRLHELTLKNCPVGILFEKAGVKITYKFNVIKE